RLESIFRKAKVALAEEPKLFPLQALSRMSLGREEAQLRDRLVRDPLLRELEDLSREGDVAIRAPSLMYFARHRLLEERGLTRSAVDLAQRVKTQPQARDEAESILAIAEGRGTFGQKFDFVLPRFSREVTKPSMLLAMAVAPLFGVAFELGGLKFAQGALGLEKIGRLGKSATFGAELLGMSGEAFGFTATHRAAERWSSGGEGFWRGAGDEMLGSMLLFGGLRLASGAGSWASRNILNPQSSRGIKGLVGAIRPAGSLAAMTASGYLSRSLGWAPANRQGFGGNLFDAALLFFQSEIGFRFANAATGGGLRNFAGEIKMRLGVGKGSALLGGDASGSTLVEPSRIPSLRLFDLNQGGLTTDFFVGPGRDAHLDPILFGNEGTKIRLFRDAQGNIFLEDRRDRVFSWAPDPARKMNFREQSLLFNGAMLPTYHPVRLVPGDVLFFPIRKLKVALPAQAPVFQALAGMPESAQRALAENLSTARTWRDFFGALEKNRSAPVATIQAEMAKVIEGETSLYSLPTELGLLPKVQELMEADLARWGREGLWEEFYSLQSKRGDPRLSPQEQVYQTLRAAEALRDRIRQSRSVEEIRDHLLNTRLGKIEETPLSELIGRVLNVFSSFREGAQRLPYASGLRQRIRDIWEERVFRDYEAYLRGGGTIPLPKETEGHGEYLQLDQKRFEIFAKLRHGVSPDDPDALFPPQELEERLYQVLERGKSLSLLPRAGQVRRDAENYQGLAIRSARKLFPGEMGAETGESNRETDYRQAIQVLNRHGRRPIVGMASREEISTLHHLVVRYLDPQASPDFPSLVERLRRHWDEATPQIRELLANANPEEKSLLLSHYFGGYRSRDLNPASALQVALWMGQYGMPQETAMIYETLQGTLRATLASEDRVQASRDREDDFFILRNVVGAKDKGSDLSRDPEILPAFEDLRFVLEQAQQYWRRGFPQRLGETPLYEPSQRLFRNWLVHPSGVSELRLSLGDSGQPTEMQVRFGLRPGAETGIESKDAESARLEALGKELGIPVTVSETSYDRLLEGLPFPIQSKTP
ncbi:MAG: hypothetical protein K8R69_08530, partial [Deltaproteobacteria bacterium]|nr:hypothetical protein [Deltaproteobacteria bacterium]